MVRVGDRPLDDEPQQHPDAVGRLRNDEPVDQRPLERPFHGDDLPLPRSGQQRVGDDVGFGPELHSRCGADDGDLVGHLGGGTGGTLNGNVTPNGLATTAWFEWGTDPSMTTYSSTPTQSVGSGTTSRSTSAPLERLSTGTTYHYRVAASNGSGTTWGSVLSLTPCGADDGDLVGHLGGAAQPDGT